MDKHSNCKGFSGGGAALSMGTQFDGDGSGGGGVLY